MHCPARVLVHRGGGYFEACSIADCSSCGDGTPPPPTTLPSTLTVGVELTPSSLAFLVTVSVHSVNSPSLMHDSTPVAPAWLANSTSCSSVNPSPPSGGWLTNSRSCIAWNSFGPFASTTQAAAFSARLE